jgi:putative hemolysin
MEAQQRHRQEERGSGSGRGGQLFSLEIPDGTPLGRLTSRLSPVLERVFALDAINAVYDRVADGKSEGFLDRVLDDLGISYRAGEADLSRIPGKGPLVVVANHPFGAIEGIVLTHLLRRVRPDVRFMANFLLGRIPELKDLFICVDPFGSERARSFNVAPIRQAMRWLKDGGALIVFPAGAVAHLDLKHGKVVEPPWSETIGRIVRKAEAPVLPVYFDGANGPLFHLLGLVHPLLRTAMLPRQLMNKCGQTLDVRIGTVLPSRRLNTIEGDRTLTDYLRQRMMLLRHRKMQALQTPVTPPAVGLQTMQPITAELDAGMLAHEVANLPPRQLIVDGGEQRVFVASAEQIPSLLREIGRLREITYRATGEGTGKPIDLDPFDQWYQHLFLWDVGAKKVVGAYRLGSSDQIIAQQGSAGLYTSTLFDYKPALISRLTPALELGRAFVRLEYQKSYSPLLMLWKGIARFVCLNPRYKNLFGPVSISNDYQLVSRHLMVQFLRSNHLAAEFMGLARAKNPFPLHPRGVLPKLHLAPEDIDDVVSDLELDGKGVPVLLRQYLKLGARFFAFNVDRGFGDSIDALMFVDLTRTESRILDRYMGREGAAEFLAHHRRLSESTTGPSSNRN